MIEAENCKRIFDIGTITLGLVLVDYKKEGD